MDNVYGFKWCDVGKSLKKIKLPIAISGDAFLVMVRLSMLAGVILVVIFAFLAPSKVTASSHSCALQVGSTCLEWRPDPEPEPAQTTAPTAPRKPAAAAKTQNTKPDPRGLPLPRSDRRKVQQALNQSGYDAGVEDGILGARSRASLGRWQRDNGYRRTGYLTRAQFTELTAALNSASQEPVVEATTAQDPIPVTEPDAPKPLIATEPEQEVAVIKTNAPPVGQSKTHRRTFDECYPGYSARVRVVTTVVSKDQTKVEISARCGPWAANSGSCSVSNNSNSSCSATANLGVSGSAPNIVVTGRGLFEDVGTGDNFSSFKFDWELTAW